MNNRRHLATTLSLALLVTFLVIASASAKGSLQNLLVYGEGQFVEITDPAILAFDIFKDFFAPYPGTPSVTTPGLVIRSAVDNRTSD